MDLRPVFGGKGVENAEFPGLDRLHYQAILIVGEVICVRWKMYPGGFITHVARRVNKRLSLKCLAGKKRKSTHKNKAHW